jgi:hypothetical protein
MSDHLFETYSSITAVDLEINLNTCAELGILNSQLRLSSSRFKIVPTILKQGGFLIGHPQQINVGYATIFATGHLMSACRWWNEKLTIEKTWTQLKSHFATAHRQHKQMQGESAATAGYHSVNTSGKAGAQIPHIPPGR